MFTFVALGNTSEIGASCHYVNLDGTGLILDCGQDPDQDGPDGLPLFGLIADNNAWPVDHVLITHAHHDHMGSLPVMNRVYPRARLHMTAPTRALLDLLLPASAKLQARKYREGSSAFHPMFTVEQAEHLGFLYEAKTLTEPFDVTGRRANADVNASFYHAGHVLGSAGILLETKHDGEAFRVFFTGDTKMRSQGIQPGGDYPEGPVDVLILEGTLGADPDAENTNRKREETRFIEAVNRILAGNGSVLVPVFALGRAQEILALLHKAQKRHQIPDTVPIFTTGSMRAVSVCYDRSRYTTPRTDPEFEIFNVPQKRFPRNKGRIPDLLKTPAIHVLSSGMMFERTHSNVVARQMLDNPKHGVLLVGYAKPGSPADILYQASRNGTETVKLGASATPRKLRCTVDRFRFSGHSHRRELISLVDRLKPKHIVLVHADESAKTWMADNLQFFYPDVTIHLPQQGIPVNIKG